MNAYQEYITTLSSQISSDLIDLTIARKRSAPPTQAFSDFLTHREQGDWAEQLFFDALKSSSLPYKPVNYGVADKIIAGDADFKKFYNSYQDELDTIGKRPDILLFNPTYLEELNGCERINNSNKEGLKIIPKATAGFEIRSSAYLVDKFSAKKERPFLSFTPKVEDLVVILKWINTYGVPHFYVQVFFDKIYLISFAKILSLLKDAKIISKGKKTKKIIGYINETAAFAIEKNPKNQYKETIHIFLNQGECIGKITNPPILTGTSRELGGGRLLHYITFQGGNTELQEKLILKIIEEPLQV